MLSRKAKYAVMERSRHGVTNDGLDQPCGVTHSAGLATARRKRYEDWKYSRRLAAHGGLASVAVVRAESSSDVRSRQSERQQLCPLNLDGSKRDRSSSVPP